MCTYIDDVYVHAPHCCYNVVVNLVSVVHPAILHICCYFEFVPSCITEAIRTASLLKEQPCLAIVIFQKLKKDIKTVTTEHCDCW